LLGVYGRAAAVDLRRLQRDPDAIPAARRRIWSLLHAGQVEESLAAADRLHALAPAEDGLSRLLVAAARRHAELPEVERSGLVTRLPLLHPVEARFVLATYVAAEPRPAP
jgi:hypothetical protein